MHASILSLRLSSDARAMKPHSGLARGVGRCVGSRQDSALHDIVPAAPPLSLNNNIYNRYNNILYGINTIALYNILLYLTCTAGTTGMSGLIARTRAQNWAVQLLGASYSCNIVILTHSSYKTGGGRSLSSSNDDMPRVMTIKVKF